MENNEILMQILEKMDSMGKDISYTKDVIKGINQRLSSIENKVSTMEQSLSDLHHEVQEGFKATRSELVDAIEAVGKKVDELGQKIHAVEDVTAQNAFDVQLMKRRA